MAEPAIEPMASQEAREASEPARTVADVVGATIASLGVHDVFGVLGSGNLIVTNALTRGGAVLQHTRHEAGAVAAADAYSRVSGRVGVASVHQGPGLTNTMTALAEAAKSRTPVLVLAGETPAAALTNNFRIDQHGLVESVGAIAERLHGAATAADDALRAYERAVVERRPVVLMLPIDIQACAPEQTAPSRAARLPARASAAVAGADAGVGSVGGGAAAAEPAGGGTAAVRPHPAPEAIAQAAEVLARAERPAIVAGRGAVLADAGPALEALAARVGAVLATSAPAHGLFSEDLWALGISGGFASPLAQELLAQSDVVLVAGASFNQWTTQHGRLFSPDATVIQVDIEPRAIGRNRPIDVPIVGDVKAAAEALTEAIAQPKAGFRTGELSQRLPTGTWAHQPYEDATTPEHIDPRTLAIELDRLLPRHRTVVVDSGHFMGWPSMYTHVPTARDWVFMNGFQAVGLGLGAGIGAAIAQPDQPTVVNVGDGGAFMALQELETAVRLKLTMLVVIYDDAAYGAEVHHFAPMSHDVSGVRFPDADIAAIAHAAGAKAATIRRPSQLEVVGEWLLNPHGPLVLDAKVNPDVVAEWLSEAFRH